MEYFLCAVYRGSMLVFRLRHGVLHAEFFGLASPRRNITKPK